MPSRRQDNLQSLLGITTSGGTTRRLVTGARGRRIFTLGIRMTGKPVAANSKLAKRYGWANPRRLNRTHLIGSSPPSDRAFEPLGELAIDGRKQIAGLGTLALLDQHACERRGGTGVQKGGPLAGELCSRTGQRFFDDPAGHLLPLQQQPLQSFHFGGKVSFA